MGQPVTPGGADIFNVCFDLGQCRNLIGTTDLLPFVLHEIGIIAGVGFLHRITYLGCVFKLLLGILP